MRTKIIKNYLANQRVYEIIGHHLLVYVKIILWWGLLLISVALAHRLVIRHITSHPSVTWTAAGLGVLIYLRGLYEFIDHYLDALVVTERGLVLFKRNGVFSYKTITMQWVSIETVTDEQNSFADTLFKKGDISIRLEEEQQTFSNVHAPAEQSLKILTWKERVLGTNYSLENTVDEEEEKNKYELLVEALGEVVSEYVEKKDRG